MKNWKVNSWRKYPGPKGFAEAVTIKNKRIDIIFVIIFIERPY